MCTSPMARLEYNEQYITKTGKLSYRYKMMSWSNIQDQVEELKEKYHKVDMVPCGQCNECRMNYARSWANRVVLEKQGYSEDECWFLTLTYAPEYLPYHRTVNTETGETYVGASLEKKDFTKFMKDLRRYYQYHYDIQDIRFFMCGEYGSALYTSRPHYHAIMFGLPLDMTKLKNVGHNDMGQPLFEHEEISKIWGKGIVKIGRVTWESACYVARYTLKKRRGSDAEWYYAIQGKIPEYVNMSRKPGIGMKYFWKHKEDIYTTDLIPVANKKTAQLVAPPKAFDRIMEELEPEFMEQLKADRKKHAEEAEKLKMQLTDMSPDEYRHNKDEQLKAKIKQLPRKEI